MAQLTAQSVNRRLYVGKQSGLGSAVAANSSSVKTLRRVSTSLVDTVATFRSKEKRSDAQVNDEGHGIQRVAGDIVGELAGNDWGLFFEALCCRDLSSVSTFSAGAGDGLSIASNVVTRQGTGTGKSFITDAGLRNGLVGKFTNLAVAADNNRPFVISGLTDQTFKALPLDGVAFTDISTGSADTDATVVIAGKRTFIPATGRVDQYFTIEDYKSDLDVSTVFTDVMISKLALNVKPNGLVDITWSAVGTGQVDDYEGSAAPYFSAPAGSGTGGAFSGVLGLLHVGGTPIAVTSGFTLMVDWGMTAPDVLFAKTSPSVNRSFQANVSGDISVLFKDHTLRQKRRQQIETELTAVLLRPDGSAFSLHLPRAKFSSDTPDDSDTTLTQSMAYTGLIKPASAAGYENTSIMFHDTAAT